MNVAVKPSVRREAMRIAGRLVETGDIVEVFNQPLVGARPKFTATYQPPLRGDAPCEGQAVASLDAAMVRARPARKLDVKLRTFDSPAQLRTALDNLVARLRKEQSR